MFDNLILSVNAVLPLFLMMALGFVIKQLKLFDDHTLRKMNRVAFNVFLPILMFQNIYTGDLAASFNPKLLIYAMATVLFIFFTSFFLVKRFVKDNPTRGVLVQSQFRSNFILFAVPALASIYGEGNIADAGIMIAIIVPAYNMLAVITFEIFRGEKIKLKKILQGIMKNPIIIGSVLGIVFQLLHIKLPFVLESTIADLSKTATPVALVILGGFFEFGVTKKWLKLTLAATLSKLLLIPAIFVPISIYLGFRGVPLAALLIMYGAPVAVSSFTTALEMEGNIELANQVTIFTSLFSVFTIFVGIFVLKSFSLI
ncbi:MAG: AEC family transporter [Oscillospiraceae bacterium]|jgi:predicted permease|nr:AEC family transporter [Oscillospiraceae bacterium]